MLETKRLALRKELVSAHGVVVTGEVMIRLLGFPSPAAFRQAKARNRIGVPVFNLPNRRGTFVLTSDIADWLSDMANNERKQA